MDINDLYVISIWEILGGKIVELLYHLPRVIDYLSLISIANSP